MSVFEAMKARRFLAFSENSIISPRFDFVLAPFFVERRLTTTSLAYTSIPTTGCFSHRSFFATVHPWLWRSLVDYHQRINLIDHIVNNPFDPKDDTSILVQFFQDC